MSVALLPDIVTATVLPLTVSVPVAVTVPVCPEPDPSVWAVVDGELTVKLLAKACCATSDRASARRPQVTFFICVQIIKKWRSRARAGLVDIPEGQDANAKFWSNSFVVTFP